MQTHQKSQLLYNIHVSSLDDICPNSPFDYQIDDHNVVRSENKLVLYSLSLYTNKKFDKKENDEVENEEVAIKEEKRQKAIFFLNRIAFIEYSFSKDQEIHYLDEFIKRENCSDLKLIIKFMDEIEAEQYKYVCAYFENQKIFTLLNNFKLNCLPLPNKYRYCKQIIHHSIPSIINVYTDQRNDSLYIFGIQKRVKQFISAFKQAYSSIDVMQYEEEGEPFTNFYFQLYQNFAEYFQQMATDICEDKKIVCIKKRSAELLKEQFKYKTIDQSIYEYLIKYDEDIEEFLLSHPDFILFPNKLVGHPKSVEKFVKHIQNFSKAHEKGSSIKQYKNQYFRHIFVNKRYKQFLNICLQFKNLYPFQFRIDIDSVRVANYAKQCSKVYIVFSKLDDIINLQSIIEDSIQLETIKQIFEEWDTRIMPDIKEIKSKNNKLTIVLYSWLAFKAKDIIQIIKNNSQYLKTIICSKQLLEQFLKESFDFNITFVTNEHLPSFPFLKEFSKIEVCMMKSPSLEKELRILKSLYLSNICEYGAIEDYRLSPIDTYNINQALITEKKSIDIVLGKQFQKQMIYLCYYSKLFQVIRKPNGEFLELVERNLQRDLPKIYDSQIKCLIKKAFVSYQNYVPFLLPFDKIKQFPLQEMQKIKNRNKSHPKTSILIWNSKLESEGEQLLRVIKNSQDFIQRNFSKIYKMNFFHEQLLKEVKDLRMGYGSLKRFKNGKWIGIEASAFIARNILSRFTQQYI